MVKPLSNLEFLHFCNTFRLQQPGLYSTPEIEGGEQVKPFEDLVRTKHLMVSLRLQHASNEAEYQSSYETSHY